MKNKILILLLSITTNLVAQKDTLYFNSAWNKTIKADAVFYRPIPLEKVGNLYLVKDYYKNGNLQMKGHWSNIKNETLEGKVSWYYENGKISEEVEYKDGYPHGISIHHTKEGFLRAKGEYKDGKFWTGTFQSLCCPGKVSEFKEGDEIAYLTFYGYLPQLAKKEVFGEGNISKIIYYDKKGDSLGQITYKDDEAVNGKFIWFYMDGEQAISIKRYVNYEYGKRNGELVTFNKNKKIKAKGICKDDKRYSGTFFNKNKFKTYAKGKLEGKEISYSEKGKLLSKGFNKNDNHWSGQFIESYLGEEISNYKNGQLEGKQTIYFSEELKRIESYHYMVNGKKEGESASFNEEGALISKGTYKDGKPFTGTFYDNYYRHLSSYKKGVKHGKYIQYNIKGKIILEEKYDAGKLTGKIKSIGHFTNKTCECDYKNGEPFSGEICQYLRVKVYKNRTLVEILIYDDEAAHILKSRALYNDKGKYKHIIYYNNKEFELTFKDNEPYNGVDYDVFNRKSIPYANGKKHGLFSIYKSNYGVLIEGNYKDDFWDGKIEFTHHAQNKTTFCTYKNGAPIDGVVMNENQVTTYVNGIKDGLETSKEALYSNYQVVYDSISRNYLKGKLEDNISYFKEGNKIAQGVYNNDKPFQGTFYEGKLHENRYKKGKLISSIYRFNSFKVESLYDNNRIVEEKLIIGTDEITSQGTFQNGTPFNGKFVTFDDIKEPKTVTYINYKNGKKNGVLEVFTISDKRITKKIEYKDDKPLKETWLIPFKEDKEVVGNYKKGEPFFGYFHSTDDIIEILNQYKNGTKSGYQYYAVTGSKMENLLDSINYINGKPFHGNELEQHEGKTHQHIYENGKRMITNIYNWGFTNVPNAEVSYTKNGFDTYRYNGAYGEERTIDNVVKEKLNQVTFTDENHNQGLAFFYKNNIKIGELTFSKGIITAIDFSFVEDSTMVKVYKKSPNIISIELKNKNELIKFHSNIQLAQTLGYNDFTDAREFLFKNDGTVFYYLDNTEKPYSSCIIKNTKPYHGIVIRQYKNSYYYEEYRDGKEYKEVKSLTKEELLKLLNK